MDEDSLDLEIRQLLDSEASPDMWGLRLELENSAPGNGEHVTVIAPVLFHNKDRAATTGNSLLTSVLAPGVIYKWVLQGALPLPLSPWLVYAVQVVKLAVAPF